ncbi:hypothetical protein C8F04DRAFT_1234333 [Mycena alexandri]|uniref:DUF6534 domain-containing protein n=1 Tax=Mycena alexandri TaxID=1745969 RepID=A0AAD6X485_9AGAR|nr:hypothetical protein C8F04DRAFT_1234333 [Mycena alexandri]
MADPLSLRFYTILLTASWLNIGLYTVELTLCGRYFARLSRPMVHRIGVGILVFADTVCTLAIGFDVGLTILPDVTTNARFLAAPLTVIIMTTYISSIIAQLFLCNLFYVLTGNLFMSGVLLILIFTHLAFSWASAITGLVTLEFTGIAFTETTVGAITCSVTDVVIAVSLAWKFWVMMKSTNPEHSTRNLLQRILMLTVSSGVVCAGNTLITMILLLRGNSAFDFFFKCQGRVYALTLLGNFLLGIPGRTRQETSRTRTTVSTAPVVFQLQESIPRQNRKGLPVAQSTVDRQSSTLSLAYTASGDLDELRFASSHGKRTGFASDDPPPESP